MENDPTQTDPDKYHVIFENERVRVLEYLDHPGGRTHPHQHPDSVMYTLSSFRRKLISGENSVEVTKEAGEVNWLPAQTHLGENTGTSDTHVIFVELKEPAPGGAGALGPQ